MKKKMFITDFDGVLCDSVIECMLVTYNAWQRLTSSSPFQRSLDLNAVDTAKKNEFRRLRPYLKGAEDFVPMLIAAEDNVTITSQKEFDMFREEHKARLSEYVEVFYAERDYLIQNEKELWLSLNPLFDGFAEELRRRSSFAGLHILTTKRQNDVLEIFKYQEIDFPAEQITYQKAAGKPRRLLEILQINEAVPEDSVYFEDQVDFLVESQKHDIGSYLVEWGYISEEQRQLAQQQNIPVIDLQKYKEILRSF